MKLLLSILSALGVLTAVQPCAATETETPDAESGGFHFIPIPKGYKLAWHDEFDGTELNPDWWTYEVRESGYYNNELETYVDDSPTARSRQHSAAVKGPVAPEGVNVTEVADGILKIRAVKHGDSIYSARIYAMVDSGWKYGIFEARIKLPKGRGTWPAFWMEPVRNVYKWPRCGEIDIMEEVGYRPDYTQSAIHCGEYNHLKHNQKALERMTPGVEDEFHTYSAEWTPEAIVTYVDGQKLLTFENDGKGDDMTWPFDKPFYMILNLAWGGSWGGMKGVDESALPAEMEVDYVRVFQKT
ncbi:MAG: glycoside hydrolase family 16 protein [Bacteroides sp.]|nr:glycoside hydrolase family 16 protein [Bacteroides sp.]